MTTAPTPSELAALGWDTIERIVIGAACQLQAINQAQGEDSPVFDAVQVRTEVSSNAETSSQSLTYPLDSDDATMLADLEALEALGWNADNLAVIKELLSDPATTVPATIAEITLTKEKSTPLNSAKFIGAFTFYLDESLPDGGQFLGNLLEFVEGDFGTFTPTAASAVSIPTLPTIPAEVNSLESLLCWACLVLNASSSAAGQFVQVSPFYATDRISISVSLPLDWEALSATGWHLVASVPRLVSEYVEIDPDNVAGELPSTIPSAQFWLDPVENLTQLKSLSATIGANCYVSSKGAIYGLIPALPDGQTVDNDLYVEPFAPSDTEVWAKGAGGSGGVGGVTNFNDLTGLPAGDYYRDLLSALSGANRLDASAIKNLPNSGTPGADGQDGQDGQGIDHISLTNTTGNTRTYTIWGDVGETINLGTFTVTDGQNGQNGAPGAQGPAGQNGAGIVGGLLTLPHTTTPSAPSSGNTLIYAKPDGGIYKRTAGGNEEAIGTGQPGQAGGREVLTQNKSIFVKSSTAFNGSGQMGGDDSSDGSASNPWLTISKLNQYLGSLDLAGFTLTVNLEGAFGSSGAIYNFAHPIGDGEVIIQGLGGNKNNAKLIGVFRNITEFVHKYTLKELTLENNTPNIRNMIFAGRVHFDSCRFRATDYAIGIEGPTSSASFLGINIFRWITGSTGSLAQYWSLIYVAYGGFVDARLSTFRTVIDDNDTNGALSFGVNMVDFSAVSSGYFGGLSNLGTTNFTATVVHNSSIVNPAYSIVSG